jgi:CHAD domain-containing protein
VAAEVREIERKYQTSETAGLPDLTGAPRVATVTDKGVVELDAVYYDTAGLRLAAAGITLRRRTGGEDAGWHLKLPAGPDARDEIRLPLRASEDVPQHLARLVRAHTRAAPLVPVVRLRSRRDLRHLLDEKGRLLAEVSHDRVTADVLPGAGGPRTRAWAEIEVELAEAGTPALLDAVEEHLAAAGVKRSRSSSKLRKALGKRAPKAPSRPAGPPATAGGAVLDYLREHAAALVDVDPAVRRDQPDAVHRMRVAARRLRSALSTFRTVLDRDATRAVADELRWLGGELGADRDREVLTARLYELVAELPRREILGPVRGRLRTWAGTRRSGTRRRVLAALDSPRYLDLLAALDTLLAEPPLLPGAAEPAPGALGRAVLRDYRRVAGQVAAATTDEERHDARKAAKRARYAAEAARPVHGPPAKALADRMKAVQETLGEYHDCGVTREALHDLAHQAHLSGEPTFTYGVLHEREGRRAREAMGRFEDVWREASRPEHRRGLTGRAERGAAPR